MSDAFILSQAISGAFGVLLSIALAFVPKLKTKFAAIDQDDKPLYVLAGCFVIAIGLVALACVGVNAGYGTVCPQFDVTFFYGFIANVITAAGSAQVTFAAVVNPLTKDKPAGG